MRVLTVFNYGDFKKVIEEYNADKVVGVYFNRRRIGDGFMEVKVMASAASSKEILELEYYRIVESEVFLDRREAELKEKANELAEMLKKDGFTVVIGYWHPYS